jgi:hypothetical protein
MGIGIYEVIFVILAALMLLVVLGGLLYIILHVSRLTKRVRDMEVQMSEMGEELDGMTRDAEKGGWVNRLTRRGAK